jgi:hypothetical protein
VCPLRSGTADPGRYLEKLAAVSSGKKWRVKDGNGERKVKSEGTENRELRVTLTVENDHGRRSAVVSRIEHRFVVEPGVLLY